MIIAKCGSAALLVAALALVGCAEKKPMLTPDVAAAAAEKCGAQDLLFTAPGDASEAPSFSYVDPGPAVAGKPTPISTCLVGALKGYSFASMKIRFEPARPVGESGS